ncbi:hypothetical protein KU306_15290 [Haloferax larsenii]|uniref:ATP-grasp domain-containing protein n=1 Tax=Haloferax larsenii TaxID=302484 RepID=A0ABY5RDJ6_HALLR|nr:hypothetical protein [Haloferax larsenii]UVE50244.1 hypothetical protein KU306_15290 [Haloferax larsenii]
MTTSQRLGIVTGTDAPELTADGKALREALRSRGFDAEGVRWMDSSVDWSDFDVALLRSCWTYYTRPDDFRDWISTVEDAGVTLLNPPDVVRWNVNKSYLSALDAAGVPVIPTAWVEPGERPNLETILRERGWEEAVVKPAIGTSSAGAWKTSLETAARDQPRFEEPFSAARQTGSTAGGGADRETLSSRGALVQEFAPEIADGERSLVFFCGAYSYAWQSFRAPDEFGVEPNFETENRTYEPDEEIVVQATEALETAAELVGVDAEHLPYARVDGIERDGEFRLMELELIEPYLDLGGHDAVADLTDAVVSVLD